MSMTIEDMRQVVSDASWQLQQADECATDLAQGLVGRLHHVKSKYMLNALKRELRDYNIHTGEWAD